MKNSSIVVTYVLVKGTQSCVVSSPVFSCLGIKQLERGMVWQDLDCDTLLMAKRKFPLAMFTIFMNGIQAAQNIFCHNILEVKMAYIIWIIFCALCFFFRI